MHALTHTSATLSAPRTTHMLSGRSAIISAWFCFALVHSRLSVTLMINPSLPIDGLPIDTITNCATHWPGSLHAHPHVLPAFRADIVWAGGIAPTAQYTCRSVGRSAFAKSEAPKRNRIESGTLPQTSPRRARSRRRIWRSNLTQAVHGNGCAASCCMPRRVT